LIFLSNFGYSSRIGRWPKGFFGFDSVMSRLNDIAAFAFPASAGPAERASAPLFDLSLLLTGPWAA
jgi:hypothetical protein